MTGFSGTWQTFEVIIYSCIIKFWRPPFHRSHQRDRITTQLEMYFINRQSEMLVFRLHAVAVITSMLYCVKGPFWRCVYAQNMYVIMNKFLLAGSHFISCVHQYRKIHTAVYTICNLIVNRCTLNIHSFWIALNRISLNKIWRIGCLRAESITHHAIQARIWRWTFYAHKSFTDILILHTYEIW